MLIFPPAEPDCRRFFSDFESLITILALNLCCPLCLNCSGNTTLNPTCLNRCCEYLRKSITSDISSLILLGFLTSKILLKGGKSLTAIPKARNISSCKPSSSSQTFANSSFCVTLPFQTSLNAIK